MFTHFQKQHPQEFPSVPLWPSGQRRISEAEWLPLSSNSYRLIYMLDANLTLKKRRFSLNALISLMCFLVPPPGSDALEVAVFYGNSCPVPAHATSCLYRSNIGVHAKSSDVRVFLSFWKYGSSMRAITDSISLYKIPRQIVRAHDCQLH